MKPIRRLREDEVDTVVSLWDENAEGLLTPQGKSNITEYMRACTHREDAFCLVAEADSGDILGFVTALLHYHPVFPGATGEIEELYVRPLVRRSGVGRLLVEAASKKLTESGAGVLHAMVPMDSPEAVEFWKDTKWENEFAVFMRYQ